MLFAFIGPVVGDREGPALRVSIRTVSTVDAGLYFQVSQQEGRRDALSDS